MTIVTSQQENTPKTMSFKSILIYMTIYTVAVLVVDGSKGRKWPKFWSQSSVKTSRSNSYLTFKDICSERTQRVSNQHTACLKVHVKRKDGVSVRERNNIVLMHNNYRGRVEKYRQPPASNMMKLVWDNEIAHVAQMWASNCYWGHDENCNRNIPGGIQLGQNVGRGQFTWRQTLKMWHNEVKYFKFGRGSKYGHDVGHYVQMVWANSTRIGCGYSMCNGSKPFYVCNYGNPVNQEYKNRPYKVGSTGSACSKYYNKKLRLCDCGGRSCKNGGWLNPKNCQCECPNDTWLEKPDCSLNCSRAEDYHFCGSEGGKMTKKHCKKYADVPYKFCPVTCGLCEASEYTTEEIDDYDDYKDIE